MNWEKEIWEARNAAEEDFEVILVAFGAETEQLYHQVIQNVAME